MNYLEKAIKSLAYKTPENIVKQIKIQSIIGNPKFSVKSKK
jgi:hypothetical protein